MIGCLRTRVRKQPIIMLYFEPENELKFYNLEASMILIFANVNIFVIYVSWILNLLIHIFKEEKRISPFLIQLKEIQITCSLQ